MPSTYPPFNRFQMRPPRRKLYHDDSDTNSDASWIQDALTALEFHNHSEDLPFSPEHTKLVPEAPNQRIVDDGEWLLRDYAYVLQRLQDGFDAEDQQRLRHEQQEFAYRIQTTFQCSICMDALPESDMARIDGCMHMMCRSCLRKFVSSKIQEHRYPILCPVCTTEADRKAEPSAISRVLMEQLGISQEQSRILTEMELAGFTVQIHCRKCRRSAFLDREDYAEISNIVCPQSNCHYVWCKKCEKQIVAYGPKHSCDGSSELEDLMRKQGWKHCPNCTTPISKKMGCHHMLCISPGCNTHFCYVCGALIVRSILNYEINAAVTQHYRGCQLFEAPEAPN